MTKDKLSWEAKQTQHRSRLSSHILPLRQMLNKITLIPTVKVQNSLDNNNVTHHNHKQLHHCVQHKAYWENIYEKHKFQDASENNIDCKVFF